MNVTYICPHCRETSDADVAAEATALVCPKCRVELSIPADAYENGQLHRCLVCPSTDLYVRKDFPQWLGVWIVVVGFAISCVTWYHYQVFLTFAVLFAVAAIDLVLYVIIGNALFCYRCSAQYRGLEGLDKHGGFNLETHERYRQQAARLASRQAVQKGTEQRAPIGPY